MQGTMQVAINDLSVDEEVNVVGMVVEEEHFFCFCFLPLLAWKNVFKLFSIR